MISVRNAVSSGCQEIESAEGTFSAGFWHFETGWDLQWERWGRGALGSIRRADLGWAVVSSRPRFAPGLC